MSRQKQEKEEKQAEHQKMQEKQKETIERLLSKPRNSRSKVSLEEKKSKKVLRCASQSKRESDAASLIAKSIVVNFLRYKRYKSENKTIIFKRNFLIEFFYSLPGESHHNKKYLTGNLAVRLNSRNRLFKMFFYGTRKSKRFDFSHYFGLHNFLLRPNTNLDNFFLLDFYKALFLQITQRLVVFRLQRLTLYSFLYSQTPLQIIPENRFEKSLMVPVSPVDTEIIIKDDRHNGSTLKNIKREDENELEVSKQGEDE